MHCKSHALTSYSEQQLQFKQVPGSNPGAGIIARVFWVQTFQPAVVLGTHFVNCLVVGGKGLMPA